jgi:diadenylate cyclase
MEIENITPISETTLQELARESSLKKEVKIIPEKELDLVDILKLFAPGTAIRLAIDDILSAGMGALIVVENERIYDLLEGGFKVNCKFSPQRLVELAKMDGAIILSKDLKKILYANSLLVPNSTIPSKETGTRHKAAERTARQINCMVVAVSERKHKITLYYGQTRYELESTSEVLRRATETLQILEKQKETFNDLLSNLNLSEITGNTTIYEICAVLQRAEMVKRISAMVKRYLVELGREGIIVSMRLKELTKNLNKELELILKDYFNGKYIRAQTMLDSMSFDFLLETQNISRILFDELHDKSISPKGRRLLGKTDLLEKQTKSLINYFKSLGIILTAEDEELMKVLKKRESVDSFKHEVEVLKEKIMSDKKI